MTYDQPCCLARTCDRCRGIKRREERRDSDRILADFGRRTWTVISRNPTDAEWTEAERRLGFGDR